MGKISLHAKVSETNAKASEDSAVSASSEAVKSANEAKKIAADLSKNIGIDDTNESYASTWSSAKIKSEFDKTSDAVPTKVSELQNDENYQNANDVKSAIAAEIAKIVADAPEDFDTLKEMSDWIASHVNDASEINSAISKNTEDISKLASEKVSSSGDVSNTIVNFDESTEDDTLTSGEPLKLLIGKIKKVLDSVKTTLKGLASIAKTGSARDLTDIEALNIPTLTNNLLATIEGTALDATQGKLIKDNIDSLKSGLANLENDVSKLNSDIATKLIRTSFTSIYAVSSSITIPLGTYWLFIGKTQYNQCSIWYVDKSDSAPVSVANICNEEMTKSITDDKMTLKWKYASYSYVLLIKINN